MSASVLSIKQQRKSLAGLKKKKKTPKNVLTVPNSIKIRDPIPDENSVKKLTAILESLLPSAKLPVCKSSEQHDSTDNMEVNKDAESESRKKFLLGVNVVSKGVSNETAACVLIADDIKPKLLIRHLLILCSLKNIPFLYMPKFRELTRKTLGFPCIVLGFKKGFADFLQVIDLIKSASENAGNLPCEKPNYCNETEPIESPGNARKVVCKQEEKPKFTYLYRESNLKRVFIPDETQINVINQEFIPLGSDDDDNDDGDRSEGVCGNTREFQGVLKWNSSQKKVEYDASDDGLQMKIFKGKSKKMEKKKGKEYGLRDGKAVNIPVEYAMSQVMKMEADPNRERKKFKKLKKKKQQSLS